MRNRCPKCKKFVKEKGFYCVGCAEFIRNDPTVIEGVFEKENRNTDRYEIKPIKYLKE